MRLIAQVAVVALLAGAGAGSWYFWGQHAIGNPPPAGGPGRGGGVVAVEYVAARTGVVVEKIESVGTVRANEAVAITAKQTGIITGLTFSEGQRVRAGQVLAELDTKERRADLDQARAMLDDAGQRLDRARQLRSGNVAAARLDELESAHRAAEARLRMAQARLDEVRVTAPFEGRVGMRQVSLGALVQPGAVITTLDDITRVKLEFAVPEVVLGPLAVGLPVAARTPAFAAREFRGQVSVIDTRIDPATRSVKVNALFDNADEALKPGMFLNVELLLAQRDDAVLVPEEAIVPEGTRHYVFVLTDKKVNRRVVRIGVRFPGEVEIAEGIKAGDLVVARGVQKIRDNQTVNPRPLKPTS